MIMVGEFYTLDVMQDWFVKKGLPVAREVLSHFNTLNEFFSSFKEYEKRRYKQTRNAVLLACLPDIMTGKPRGESIKRLWELEEALLAFDVTSWPKKKMNYLEKRLCSDDYHTSLTQYTELAYAKRLRDRLGKGKVEIYPKLTTGKFSDVLVRLKAKNVYVEVGNLSESLPEKKIQKIVSEIARHLGSKLKILCHLLVEIDTAELVFDAKGHIDEKASIEKFASEMDRLCIDKLAGFEGLIILDTISYVIQNRRLLEDMDRLLPPGLSDDLKSIEVSPVKEWAESCKDQIIQGSKLVKSIIGARSRSLLVEVHTESFYPSVVALAERDSFINHVIRHVEAQLRKQQLQPNSPNVIAVQGFNWVVFGFNETWQDIEPLYGKIKEFLSQRKEEHLSGIALFTDFGNLIFVPNEQADEPSKLSKNEVVELGMHCIFDQVN